MPRAEIVMNVETGHHRREPFARLVHGKKLGDGVAHRRRALVGRRSATSAIVF